MGNYKDPKDLRDLSLDRLKFEGNQLAYQFAEWNDLFSIESAIRVKGALKPIDYHANPNQFSELEKWAILSNRYLLMEREYLSEYKLFTKDEVLKMIKEAYYMGYNDAEYKDKEGSRHDTCEEFMKEKASKL